MDSSTPLTIPQSLQIARQALVAGDFGQAERVLKQILQLEPQQPQALHLLGRVALQSRRPDLAVQVLTTSAMLRPEDPLVQLDLGTVFLMLGRLREAEEAYRRSLQIDPNHAGAWGNLGVVLHEQGHPAAALEAFEKALALEPNLADRHNNLASALTTLGRSHEAVSAYRRALELNPGHANARQNLAHALKDIGRIDEAIGICRELVAQRSGTSVVHSNQLLYMMYSPSCSPDEIFQEHRRWNHLHAVPLKSQMQPHENDRSPERRLRIGYLSPDLREHSVAFFFEGLLEAHDPGAVEVFCYADMLRKPDDTSERLKKASHHWTNITGMSDAQVTEIVRKDQIDILVDLAGHTSGTRLLVFARKPAPVQVSYLGYPNTTGLDAIDYYITDEHLDPPGAGDALYSEQLIRLPGGTFACYRPPTDAPDISPLPARSNGHVTFASFNPFPKINADVIRVWSNILQRISESKLLIGSRGMESPAMTDQVRSVFAEHGVTPDRLQFEGYQRRSQYLATHNQIDILLDTFPVNGHTITCHALWMGVPVVSLAGANHFGRLGASVLNNLKLSELLAHSEEQYVNVAAALAGDVPRLEELRFTLRDRMSRSALMDPNSLARHIEHAYLSTWRNWAQGESHDHVIA